MGVIKIIWEVLLGGGSLLFGLMSLVQVTPIKINPLSWVARKVGRAVNGEVLNKLGTVEQRLDEHITMDDRRTADGHRTRILHFNNELLREIEHTKEEFVEALGDIDAYEEYCRTHQEYPNNRAVLAIDNIRSTYKDRLKKHDFLQA